VLARAFPSTRAALFWCGFRATTIATCHRNAPPATSKTTPVTFGTHLGSCTSWLNHLESTRTASNPPGHIALFTRREQRRYRQHPHSMAAARAKAANVGSTQWVQKEREQAGEFVEQEFEEFGYSVRNEMEWLNEHMAEIFSTNAVYVALPTRLTRLFANAPQKLRRRV
jgi:hypothetical protein